MIGWHLSRKKNWRSVRTFLRSDQKTFSRMNWWYDCYRIHQMAEYGDVVDPFHLGNDIINFTIISNLDKFHVEEGPEKRVLETCFHGRLHQTKEEVHVPLTAPRVPRVPEHPSEVQSNLWKLLQLWQTFEEENIVIILIGGETWPSLVWVKILTKPHSFSSMMMDLSSIWVKTSMVLGTLLATNSMTVVPSASSMSRWAWSCHDFELKRSILTWFSISSLTWLTLAWRAAITRGVSPWMFRASTSTFENLIG